jgi:hypothetical protein
VWEPSEKQAEFLAASELEVGYGGAAYGGKTDALVIDALGLQYEATSYRRYKGILFRDNFTNMQEVIDRTLLYYPQIIPGARYNKSEHIWTFPSGAQILLKHMENANVKLDHQGAEYQWIGWEELTLFQTDEAYKFLFSRLRCPWGRIPLAVRSTFNPGNVGHQWVKERFRIPDEGTATCFEDVEEIEGIKVTETRRFIPARIDDNPHAANDPTYRHRLLKLGESDRKRLLHGRWDVYEGQFFTEWNPRIHIIDPLRDVPTTWTRWRSLDWGSRRPYCVLWMLEDYDGNIHVYRELYGWGGKPDVGTGEKVPDVAAKIVKAEGYETRSGIVLRSNPADPSIWIANPNTKVETERSIGHTFQSNGVRWAPAAETDNSRISGWDQVRMRLENAVKKKPNGLFIWRRAPGSPETVAPHLVRTLPLMAHDPDNDGDLLKDGMEDHPEDCLRYGVMRRRLTPRKPNDEKKRGRVNINPRRESRYAA